MLGVGLGPSTFQSFSCSFLMPLLALALYLRAYPQHCCSSSVRRSLANGGCDCPVFLNIFSKGLPFIYTTVTHVSLPLPLPSIFPHASSSFSSGNCLTLFHPHLISARLHYHFLLLLSCLRTRPVLAAAKTSKKKMVCCFSLKCFLLAKCSFSNLQLPFTL